MLAPEAGRVRINVAMVIILMYAVFFFCHLHIDYHFFFYSLVCMHAFQFNPCLAFSMLFSKCTSWKLCSCLLLSDVVVYLASLIHLMCKTMKTKVPLIRKKTSRLII